MDNSSSDKLIVAFFNNHSDAERAMRDLQTAGFRSDQIGSSYEDYDADDLGVRSSSAASQGTDHRSFWQKIEDFFTGEAHDRKDKTTLTSGWSDRGIAVPARYADRMSSGGELVSVQAAGRETEATEILTRNNGQIDNDFSYAEHPSAAPGMGQGTRADITGGTMTPGMQARESGQEYRESSRTGMGDTGERRIQLVSEVLRVRKERAERGEVRLRKEVRTETQNVQVPVTREELVIERNPVEGQRTASAEIGSDSEIRVPLTEERVQVDKVPVVTEEVRVSKRPVSETRNVTDQVRREELDVEGADEEISADVKKRKTA